MIRPVLTELALFLAPFALYAAYLLATRANVFDPSSWTWRIVGWLLIAAFATVIVSFVLLAQFSGTSPHSTYEPARMENGTFVPGRTR